MVMWDKSHRPDQFYNKSQTTAFLNSVIIQLQFPPNNIRRINAPRKSRGTASSSQHFLRKTEISSVTYGNQRHVVCTKQEPKWSCIRLPTLTRSVLINVAAQGTISGLGHGVNEVFALLGSYIALIGSYLRFGTPYQSHLQGSRSPCLTLEDGTDRHSRNVCKYQTTLCKEVCYKSVFQKNMIYITY